MRQPAPTLPRREYRDHRLEWMVKSGGSDIVLACLRNQHDPLSLARSGRHVAEHQSYGAALLSLIRNWGHSMLLYEAPGSPYAQKVKIALREKGIECELPETLGTGLTDGPFGIDNPRAEVPLLVDEEVRIFDSTVILEYVEERWPDPPLLPRDPAARAFARLTEDVCDTHYEAVTWGYSEVTVFVRAAGPLAESLRLEAARQTAVLQDWLAGRLGNGAWFGGTTFGWADTAVAPVLHRSVLNGMGPSAGSALARWYDRLKQRPSVAATFAEYAAAAASLPATVEAFRTGKKVREYRDHRLEWMIKSGGVDVILAGLRDGSIRFSWP